MRIAYVINSVEGGGAAAPVPAVARVLRGHGATVGVFALTGRDRRGLPAMLANGLPVNVRVGGEDDHLSAYLWLSDRLAAWRPDVIWTSLTRATLLGQAIGQRQRRPVVSWQHAAFLKPANRWLLRARQSRSLVWIADSQCVARLTKERLAVPEDRVMLWPLFSADPGAAQAEPWRLGEPVRIGSLGRLHPVKGYDVLIRAMAILRETENIPPYEVHIAGDGAERAALERASRDAGLTNLHFAGHIADPQRFLAGLHLYVQPSRSEGLCIAVHEAMQAGLPAIVSAVGEMPYSVCDGETGLTVPPGDAVALAAAIGMLLRRPDQCAAMGTAARERILSRFAAEAFAAAGGRIMARLDAYLSGGAIP